MPGPLVIPLLLAAPEAGTALTALGAAGAAYLAGNAFKNTMFGNNSAPTSILTPQSSSTEFTDATANYLKAEQDREAAKGVALGKASAVDLSTSIAQNYDYIGVKDDGTLAVLSDGALVAGGDITVVTDQNNINYSNGVVVKIEPYQDYNFNQPTAVTNDTPINVSIAEDGVTPLVSVSNATIDLSNSALVAQTSLTAQNSPAGPDLTAPGETPAGIGQDQIPFDQTQNSTIARGDLPDTPTALQSPDVIDPGLQAEMAREAQRAGAWNEDAATTSDIGAVQQAGSLEQARAAERADANALASTDTPGGITTAPPAFRSGFQDVVDPSVNSQESAKNRIVGAGVNRDVSVPGEKPNPLHAYTNYTYKISLYAIPKTVMNQIASGMINPGGEDAIIAQGQLILSSGGSQTSDKGSMWQQDFFIDNLQLKSIVGVSARNRSTDVVEINFEVVEPYTITFLPRLIATAYALTGYPDWAMCFYLMKIQFLGYDDDGQPVNIPKTTKFVPMSFVNMQFEVTHKGAVYKMKGIPCHMFATTNLDNTIPFHMEITGGTVEEIFNSGDTKNNPNPDVQNDPNAGSAGSTGDRLRASDASGTGQTATAASAGPQTFNKGVKTAMNDNQKQFVANKKQTFANTYNFKFLDGLGTNTVVDPKNWNAQGFRMSDAKNPSELVGKTVKLDNTKGVFRVQAGTKITDLIGSVLQVSNYMSDQYQNNGGATDKPLFSYKITPQVKFGEMDPLTNMWQRDVTYVVMPYIIYGNDAEGFGQKAPPGAVKKYKWIFTGGNKDIIDLKIDIQSAFFNIRNGAESYMLEADKVDDDSSNPKPLKQGPFPSRYIVVNGIADANNTGARTASKKTLAVEELMKKQFDSVADNMKLDITIVGDPDLIQQDNIFYGVEQGKDKMIYDHGSINYDHYEAYFNLEFRGPVSDYDDNSGLFDLNSAGTEMFSGLYKILQVTSEFRGGKFTQKLENYRVKNQSNQGTQTPSESTQANVRAGSTATSGGGVGSATYTQTVTGQGLNLSSSALTGLLMGVGLTNLSGINLSGVLDKITSTAKDVFNSNYGASGQNNADTAALVNNSSSSGMGAAIAGERNIIDSTANDNPGSLGRGVQAERTLADQSLVGSPAEDGTGGLSTPVDTQVTVATDETYPI